MRSSQENKIKLLIVEDNPELSKILAEDFSEMNFLTFHANDGMEALEFLRKVPIDIVITDLHMPKIDGLGLKELATVENISPNILWFAYSGFSEHTPDFLKSRGFEEIFYKPLNPKFFEKIIYQKINARNAEDLKAA